MERVMGNISFVFRLPYLGLSSMLKLSSSACFPGRLISKIDGIPVTPTLPVTFIAAVPWSFRRSGRPHSEGIIISASSGIMDLCTSTFNPVFKSCSETPDNSFPVNIQQYSVEQCLKPHCDCWYTVVVTCIEVTQFLYLL